MTLTKLFYAYKGKAMSVAEILELPECEVSVTCLRYSLKKGMSVEEAMSSKKEKYQKKWEYKGKLYTVRELSELPECKVGVKTLSSRIYDGIEVSRAVTMARKNKPPVKVENVPKNQKEEFKKIMSRPVNPLKCRYTAYANGLYKEVSKGGFFKGEED